MGNDIVNVFDDEKDFENAVIELLNDCGWEKDVLSYPSEQDLINNWAEILFANNRGKDKLGDFPLTSGEMEQILEQIVALRTPSALNGFINGKSITIIRDNPEDELHFGKEISLHIYDRNEIAGGKSRYQIVRQPRFKAAEKLFPPRRGDLMLLINGMPVFHIELKRSEQPVSQAYNQIRKYSEEGIFRGIFSLVQIFIAMTPNDAVYFTNPGSDKRFNDAFAFHWANVDNEPYYDWADFTKNLLYIPMAHKLIGFYTIADGRDGMLKVLRSYQFYAVSEITNKVRMHNWFEKNQRGGYVWHTTGSGKTLTSFKVADLIAKTQIADKVVFLVDRKELDTQSLENYRFFADNGDEVQDTNSTDVLVSKLKSAKPNDALIVASIQKMSRVGGDEFIRRRKDIERINKKRLVFIVDECHRDTFGKMMRAVKDTFPYALFFGFTGTPIQEENKKKGCTSTDVFGDELHRYTIADGIRDKNVLPFGPCMVRTFDDDEIRHSIALERAHAGSDEEARSDPKKKKVFDEFMYNMPMAGDFDGFNRTRGIENCLSDAQYETDEHVDAVVENISKKFDSRSRGKRFHAIFATSSIREAIRYYKKFKFKAPELKVTVLVDPSDNNDETSYEKLSGLAEIIGDYNARYGQNYAISTYDEMKKDISLRLAHDKCYRGIENEPKQQLDMLIVVNQMLTGYDSKWINALYLDKLMKQENIIQAFSRTNRIFGHEKPVGQIYYYRYPYTMQRNIEEAVEMYSGRNAYMIFVDKLECNLVTFNAIYTEIKDMFESEGIANFSKLPEEVALRVRFAHKFNELNAILEMIKVQDFTWKQTVYGDITVLCTEEEYYTLVQRYKELPTPPKEHDEHDDPPYDLKSYISEIYTEVIDAEYINSRFKKYYKLKCNNTPKEEIEKALQELFKSFALLTEDDQKLAEIFISDVQLGNVVPSPDKTFKDYIAEYARAVKDDQIHRFARTFGMEEVQLREFMAQRVKEDDLNQFGRFESLKDAADKEKIKEYFSRRDGIEVSVFKANARFDNLLRRFILAGGFDV